MQPISTFINDSFSQDIRNTYALTIRADGHVIVNSHKISPWSTGAVPTLPRLNRCLDRTVIELTQPKQFRSTKFVAFLGGDRDRNVAPHFHAFIELPSDCNAADFFERFEVRFRSKVSASFDTHSLRCSVFAEPLQNKIRFSEYSSRNEGQSLDRDLKPVMSKSMRV